MHHRGREQGVSVALRTDRQQSPSGALLARGRVPDGAPQKPCRKLQGFFLLPLKKAGASAHFSGNTRYRYDGGQCPPPTDKPEAAFWRGVSAGWGTPPYVLKGSLWGMSDIYRAKDGQRASGMSIKFQKFRDSSAKNSK